MSEGLGLAWDHVDFVRGERWMDADQTKTGEARTFPFDEFPDLEQLLRDQLARTRAIGRQVPWVFHRTGRPIKDFRYQWKKACEAAGVPGMVVHDLRRYAIRNLVRAGVSEQVAMELSGHKTPSIFRRYNITDDSDKRAAVAKLSAYRKKGAEAACEPERGIVAA